MINTLDTFSNTAEGWQRSLYAFLAEKEQRSGSRRTAESYSRMLQYFFGRVGKQPDQVTSQEIFVYSHGPGLSGKQPSAITIGARIACLSSFYHFLIRMDIAQSSPLRQASASAGLACATQRPFRQSSTPTSGSSSGLAHRT